MWFTWGPPSHNLPCLWHHSCEKMYQALSQPLNCTASDRKLDEGLGTRLPINKVAYRKHHFTTSCGLHNFLSVQWNLAYPNLSNILLLRLSGLDLCAFYLMPMVHTKQSSYTRSFEGRSNPAKLPEFQLSKEIEVWLAPKIDNVTGKETAVLIMIHYWHYL